MTRFSDTLGQMLSRLQINIFRSAALATVGLLSVIGVFSVPRTMMVKAHSGTGPPYLMINSKYAQTNPLYIPTPNPKVNVGLDIAPEVYLVNVPIHFVVDQVQLQIPDDVFQATTFRWSWNEGETATTTGTDIHHTYSVIGSHLMSLEAKGPDSADFVLIDSVQLDILPTLEYQRPSLAMMVVGKNGDTFRTGSPIQFFARAAADPSASISDYFWVLDKEHTSSNVAPVNTYTEKDFFTFAYVRVRDSQGFQAFAGSQVSGDNGQITFFQPPATEGLPFIDAAQVRVAAPTAEITQRSGRRTRWWSIGGGIALILIVGSLLQSPTIKRRQP